MLLFIAVILLGSCQAGIDSYSGPDVKINEDRVDNNNPRLNLFLTLKNTNGPGMRLDVKDFEVRVDRVWVPLGIAPMTFDSQKISATQLFLGSQSVLRGSYDHIRFTVTKSFLQGSSGKYELVTTDSYIVELELFPTVILNSEARQSFFLTWDVERSLENTGDLRPIMTVVSSLRQLNEELLYVTCPDIDTIFVIQRNRNWVVDSFGIPGKPTYMAISPDVDSQLLYVLASRKSRIEVVELNSLRIINSFPVPFIEEPEFMVISPDGQKSYVLDKRDNYLDCMELATGRLLSRVQLEEYGPEYAVFMADNNLLAISSDISQTVSFYDSNDLTQVAKFETSDSPDGLLAYENRLYVAESGANTVSIFDLGNNIRQRSIAVGFNPRRLLNVEDRIYVSNYTGGSLSVIFPGQLSVGWEITGFGRPLEMVYDPKNLSIYIVDEEKRGVAIVDTTINKLKGYIILGEQPLDFAIVHE